MGKIEIGELYRCKKTFELEDSNFKKGTNYFLLDIIEEETFTLYIFNDGLLFGDNKFEKDFQKKFINTNEERIINLNKLMYED